MADSGRGAGSRNTTGSGSKPCASRRASGVLLAAAVAPGTCARTPAAARSSAPSRGRAASARSQSLTRLSARDEAVVVHRRAGVGAQEELRVPVPGREVEHVHDAAGSRIERAADEALAM